MYRIVGNSQFWYYFFYTLKKGTKPQHWRYEVIKSNFTHRYQYNFASKIRQTGREVSVMPLIIIAEDEHKLL